MWFRRKRRVRLVRTWEVRVAVGAWCSTCQAWLDDHDCTLRSATLRHKAATGHLPELFRAA